MNTKDNRRKKDSRLKIERAFAQLLQTQEVREISITDICKLAHVNRSTFYANYLDIYDLLDRLRENMITQFEELYHDEYIQGYNSNDFVKLFHHIKENQLFYNTYFKLKFDVEFVITKFDTKLAEKYYQKKDIDYHMEFFRGGISSIIKKWLGNYCDKSPEELFEIIKQEYTK